MENSNYRENEIFEKLDSLVSLSEAEFFECTFKDLDLSDQDLSNSKFLECQFLKCNMSNSRIVNATFRDVTFQGCKQVGLNWSTVNSLSTLSFTSCLLDYCVFHEQNLSGTLFENCSLRDVDFSNSKMKKSKLCGSNLLNASFNGCDLTESDLREAINYFIEPEFTKIKKAKFSMPQAMVLFEALGIIVEP